MGVRPRRIGSAGAFSRLMTTSVCPSVYTASICISISAARRGTDQSIEDKRMSQFPSAVPRHGGEVGLPTVVEELLVDVVADGFTLYCCGPKLAPNALVAAYEWAQYVDLLTIRDFSRVTTARVPKRGAVNIFAPEAVVWAYEGAPQQALRALLDLVHPAHPDAPIAEFPAPAGLHVPRSQQRPMTIRPPSLGHARVRADRLATAIRVDRAVSAIAVVGIKDPQLVAG
jgi:hypothetical protein